ncbi:ISAzo13-like element transposase-related protein, partial [Microcoleus sp. AT3-D2]|uniref:ISAzo13-like element transposase-related protein n=1 Tax=Microcoleus sp. AT3-D2 TaxID=2818612 RepID=UPI003B1D9CDB
TSQLLLRFTSSLYTIYDLQIICDRYKYNPIEHRLFPHITRAGQGVIFTSLELVKVLVEKTHTKTGLSVAVNILNKVYQTGRKVADNFKNTMQIVFDEYLPKWNYRAVPQPE